MTRPPRRALLNLAALGTRLRELRLRSGLSQMQLARAIGFNPTHGYKYVLRLEKGLLPNPTLRTIASVLDACHADWQAIADVLPAIADSPAERPARSVPTPAVVIEPSRAPSPQLATARGGRPLREWLRLRRREEQRDRQRRHWQLVGELEERVARLVSGKARTEEARRQYLGWTRRLLATVAAHADARPALLTAELDKVVQAGVSQGLDRELLHNIRTACLEVSHS